MKRISNVICTVLIVIGAIIAIMYASYEQPNTVKDTYGNGVYTVDENGNQAYIQYFDIGKTEKSRENDRKILAGSGFCVYAITVLGAKYFVSLRMKTKAEINKMEESAGNDIL